MGKKIRHMEPLGWWKPPSLVKKEHSILVGGFSPTQLKDMKVKNGNLPQIGVKDKTYLKPPPSITHNKKKNIIKANYPSTTLLIGKNIRKWRKLKRIGFHLQMILSINKPCHVTQQINKYSTLKRGFLFNR